MPQSERVTSNIEGHLRHWEKFDQHQSRPTRLGYQALQSAFAASLARPYIPPSPDNRKDAAHYIALWEGYTFRHALELYDRIHAVRFRETAGVFGPYLESGKSILELGGRSRFGAFCHDAFRALYQNYENDLREPYELPSDTFDIVLCLETLQYMKDTEASEIGVNRDEKGTWNYSGVLNVFYEAFRVLRPGGVLLITTPNATSVDVLGRVLSGHHPYLFDPHVREFAPMQIKALAELAGFELELFGTFFAWGECSAALRQKLSEMISLMGFDTDNRGDDAYFAFRRPVNASDFVSPPKEKEALVAQNSNTLPEPLGAVRIFSSDLQETSASSPSQSRLAGGIPLSVLFRSRGGLAVSNDGPGNDGIALASGRSRPRRQFCRNRRPPWVLDFSHYSRSAS